MRSYFHFTKINSSGGGSNFGVVYEFVMRVHPHEQNCFGGFIAFTVDKIPKLAEIHQKLTQPYRPDMTVIVGVGAPETEVLFL